MTVLQAWLFIGVPAGALGLAMFIGSSRWRPLVGYLILLVGFAAMAVFHAPSGALFGVGIALLYAAGRGGSGERAVASLSATGLAAAEAAERARTREPTAEPGEGGSHGSHGSHGERGEHGEQHPTPSA